MTTDSGPDTSDKAPDADLDAKMKDPIDTEHPTGEAQAAENAENESPA